MQRRNELSSPEPVPAPDPSTVLPRGFYERPVETVARGLLGCLLVRTYRGRPVGGRIVEVEAYGGPGDPGSHAHRAPNGRARIMFGRPGIAYVYFTYGMHHCMNAVTGSEGVGSAVLIRAIEPLWGLRSMRSAGAPDSLPDHRLGAGPARTCRALRVDKAQNGADLVTGRLRIHERRVEPEEIRSGVRIGLSRDDERPWRFWTPSRSVSR